MTRRGWLLGPLLLAAGATGVLAQPDTDERIRQLERQVEAAITKAERSSTESKGVLGEVEALDRAIAERDEEVAGLGRSIEEHEAGRVWAERRIGELEAEHRRLRVATLDRTRGLHRLARRGWGPVLFRTPGDLGQALRFRRYLTAILDDDATRLGALAESATRLTAARDEAGRLHAELTDLRERRSLERSRLRARRAAKAAVLASLEEERTSQGKLAAELAASAEKLRAWLVASRSKPTVPAVVRGGGAGTGSVGGAGAGAQAGAIAPLLGTLGAVTVARNGVEIEAEAGAVVVAIRPGRVVFADWFPGYGRMLIVDHGDHVHSIYGSTSELLVGVDETVAAGQPIARVGSTGLARSPRLYFEVRVAGKPKDPATLIAHGR